MEQLTVRQLTARVFELLGEKLGARGDTLETRLSRIRRKLPRSVRSAVNDLVAAEKMAQDPKLVLQLDPEHTSSAYARCVTFLDGIDPIEARSRKRYTMAASISAQLLLVALACIAVLQWRGYF